MRPLRVALLVLAILVTSAPAAVAAVAAAVPGSFAAGFATPVVVVERGEKLTFYSADLPQHDFVALNSYLSRKAARRAKWCSGFPAGKCPVFWSPRIGAGESTQVLGLNRVRPGKQYTFYCSLHPGMKGTLVVR